MCVYANNLKYLWNDKSMTLYVLIEINVDNVYFPSTGGPHGVRIVI